MYRTLAPVLLVSLLTVASGVSAQEAAPAPAPEAATASAPEAAPAAPATTSEAAPVTADAAHAGLISAPPEGKGQIVFFREKKFAGSAVRYKVREGEKELGKLSSGTYFVVVAEPGAHEYTVHSEAKDILTLEVEPGETYYVKGDVAMGMFVGRPNLSPADVATFDGMSAKLKLAQ